MTGTHKPDIASLEFDDTELETVRVAFSLYIPFKQLSNEMLRILAYLAVLSVYYEHKIYRNLK